jgi:hypothetical protein
MRRFSRLPTNASTDPLKAKMRFINTTLGSVVSAIAGLSRLPDYVTRLDSDAQDDIQRLRGAVNDATTLSGRILFALTHQNRT